MGRTANAKILEQAIQIFGTGHNSNIKTVDEPTVITTEAYPYWT